MKFHSTFAVFLMLAVTAIFSGISPAFAQTNNEIFEKMLGSSAKMDATIAADVLKSKPGTKIPL